MISITENEGNARLSCALPKIHVAHDGHREGAAEASSDLALFLPMLATMPVHGPATLTCYNTLYRRPAPTRRSRWPGASSISCCSTIAAHELLADAEQRDSLHCIRCGACLNVCPVFRNIGGHSYGTTYQGPIGSVITPHLRGLQQWKHLSNASSLCGACTAACPVKIDLHHHLLHNRRNAAAEKPTWWEQWAFRGFAVAMNHPALYHLAGKLAHFGQKFHPLVKNTLLDPARSWTRTRETPQIAAESFKDLWRARKVPTTHA